MPIPRFTQIIFALIAVVILDNVFYIKASRYFVRKRFGKHDYHLYKNTFLSFWLLCTHSKDDILSILSEDLNIAVEKLMQKIKSGDKIVVKTHIHTIVEFKFSYKPEKLAFKQKFILIMYYSLIALLTAYIRKLFLHEKPKLHKISEKVWYRLIWTKN